MVFVELVVAVGKALIPISSECLRKGKRRTSDCLARSEQLRPGVHHAAFIFHYIYKKGIFISNNQKESVLCTYIARFYGAQIVSHSIY